MRLLCVATYGARVSVGLSARCARADRAGPIVRFGKVVAAVIGQLRNSDSDLDRSWMPHGIFHPKTCSQYRPHADGAWRTLVVDAFAGTASPAIGIRYRL